MEQDFTFQTRDGKINDETRFTSPSNYYMRTGAIDLERYAKPYEWSNHQSKHNTHGQCNHSYTCRS